MLKKIVLLSSLLVTSLSAHATLISHFGYERDSASNVVIGGGLEWLKWDVTKGLSIDSALDLYASDGWRLASNVDMASLFNSFVFGNTDGWNANEEEFQRSELPWNSGDEYSHHIKFMELFGVTRRSSCADYGVTAYCYSDDDPLIGSYAFFGADNNENDRYNLAEVLDDYTLLGANGAVTWYGWHNAVLNQDRFSRSHPYSHVGVSLVRNYVPDPVAVPTPGSIGLLALGLVALGYRRRQVLGR